MSDTNHGPIDLDTLTDDEVMDLSPEQVQQLMDQEDAEDEQQIPAPEGSTEDDPTDLIPAGTSDDEPITSLLPDDPNAEVTDELKVADVPVDGEKPKAEAPVVDTKPEDVAAEDPNKPAEASKEGEKPKAKTEVAPKTPEGEKPTVKPEDQKPAGLDPKVATDFMTEIMKPFKADGQEFQAKTSAEVIRLMQFGVNYSRRMKEMKPLRAQDAMLKQHGLDDPAKLSELIEISKGNPAAIQKLLKEQKIDPLDIDTSKESTFKAVDHQVNPKDLAFKEAIDSTLLAPGGRELIADMNKDWDAESKEALHNNPEIFDNLLAQQAGKVYSQIKTEVARQRTLGFLTNIPFLQAYNQVGDAMQKVGVFTPKQVHSGEADIAPIDTGTRKAAQPKTVLPNPNLSSTPPRAAPTPVAVSQDEPDYSALSDEEFNKLGIPG